MSNSSAAYFTGVLTRNAQLWKCGPATTGGGIAHMNKSLKTLVKARAAQSMQRRVLTPVVLRVSLKVCFTGGRLTPLASSRPPGQATLMLPPPEGPDSTVMLKYYIVQNTHLWFGPGYLPLRVKARQALSSPPQPA